MTNGRRILEGIRVLDFTRVVAGPYCTRMLADMGADVIKVDGPLPPRAAQPVRSNGSVANNLGKRSISIDLKHPDGGAVARDLAASVDVVVENFTPGVMDRLGLGYDMLSERNPRLVFASISGFGQSGSFSHRRAYGATAHAEAGWLWVQQQAQGGHAPFAPGVTVADIVTGMSAFSAIVSALYDRGRTGRGQRIDVTLMDCQLAMLSEVAVPALNGETEANWTPVRHPVHATRDGHVTINIGGLHNWKRIAEGLGHAGEAMPSDQAAANAKVAGWVASLTIDEVARGLERAGAPYGVTKSMPAAATHPYFAERGMVAEMDDSVEGRLRVVSSPLFFSDAVSAPSRRAPLAGEQTRELLAEAGFATDRIDALIAAGAVGEQAAPAATRSRHR